MPVSFQLQSRKPLIISTSLTRCIQALYFLLEAALGGELYATWRASEFQTGLQLSQLSVGLARRGQNESMISMIFFAFLFSILGMTHKCPAAGPLGIPPVNGVHGCDNTRAESLQCCLQRPSGMPTLPHSQAF